MDNALALHKVLGPLLRYVPVLLQLPAENVHVVEGGSNRRVRGPHVRLGGLHTGSSLGELAGEIVDQ